MTSNDARRPATARAPKPGAFSREQLIADTRQLADILESSHPDPCINGEGRIAFHRRLHRVWSFVNGAPIAKRGKPVSEPPGFQYLRASPTFRPEFESGTYGGYYQPKTVMALCDAGTISTGFSVAAGFHRLGAILVGTPSAQAPNLFGAAAVWKLKHTGIEGMVPMIAATHFPDSPEKARSSGRRSALPTFPGL